MNINVKKDKFLLILAFLAVVFFCIYSYLPFSQLMWQNEHQVANFNYKFNTPDEVINNFFSTNLADNGQLYYVQPLNVVMNRVVFPRWALVVGNKVTPGNFLGIDLIYGNLGKIFSKWVIPFLTPIFALFGILFFYLLFKIIFNKQVAFISSLMLFVFPGWWYYSSRTMFHNVLFVSLLSIGFYFLTVVILREWSKAERVEAHLPARQGFRGCNWPVFINSIFTGIFFGLALITRTSEIVWVFLIVLIVLSYNFKKIKYLWPYLLLSLMFFSLCFVPVFCQNKILYDNYFSTGYPLNTVSTNLESGETGSISFVRALILPFGFHPRVIVTHAFWKYVIKLFWPWVILWLAGLIVFLKSKKTKSQKIYFTSLLVVSCYLFIYYGSWFFRDSIDPDLISLGSSYVRYFLPIFVMSMPLIGLLLAKVFSFKSIQCQKSQAIRRVVIGCTLLVIVCLVGWSGYQVLWQGPESLTTVRAQLIKYQNQAQDIFKYVAKDDILLLSAGTDKIVFPELKNIVVPQNGVEWPEIKNILPHKKVFYFENNTALSQDYLNEIKFNPQGLKIENEVLIDKQGKLFQVFSNQ